MQHRTLWLVVLNNFSFESFTSSLILRSRLKVNLKDVYLFGPLKTIKNELTYNLVIRFVTNYLKTNKMFSNFFGFAWFRFVLFSGLGYKRRFYKRFKIMFAYIGDRHWISLRLARNNAIAANRRRNFVFFSNTKGALSYTYSFFTSLRRPYVYKMKGFLDTRVRGRFLFVRRIKIRGVRTKLSKKQQLL